MIVCENEKGEPGVTLCVTPGFIAKRQWYLFLVRKDLLFSSQEASGFTRKT